MFSSTSAAAHPSSNDPRCSAPHTCGVGHVSPRHLAKRLRAYSCARGTCVRTVRPPRMACSDVTALKSRLFAAATLALACTASALRALLSAPAPSRLSDSAGLRLALASSPHGDAGPPLPMSPSRAASPACCCELESVPILLCCSFREGRRAGGDGGPSGMEERGDDGAKLKLEKRGGKVPTSCDIES